MTDKNVVIVGVLNNPLSSNVWMANSFIKCGLNVIPVNYRTIIQNYGHTFFKDLIIDTVKNHSPYLTIFCKCNGVDPNIISECSKFSPTWLWMPDSYIVAQQHPEIVEHTKRTTFSSCQSQTTVDYFKEKGAKNCYHIYEGIDKDVHYPVEPVEKYKADVSFIGSRTPERDKYKKLLEDEGYTTKFYGEGYSGVVSAKEWREICSSSKFMLSINTFNDIPDYFSGRVFEYAGSGACILHYNPSGGSITPFEENKEIVYFKDEKDLLSKLKNIYTITARKIGINGRKKVMEKYTLDHSVRQIINIVEGSK